MFSSGKKKDGKSPRNKGERNNDMANMLGIGVDMESGGFDDGNDDDLEAELAALQGRPPKKKTAKKSREPMSMNEIDNLVAQSTQGIDVDIDDDDDEDLDDEDLLSELAGIADGEDDFDDAPEEPPPPPEPVAKPPPAAPVSSSNEPSILNVLLERQKMYQTAISNADSSKARRLGRGLKEIESQIKAAKSGRSINPDDIPPMVSTGASKPPVPSQNSPAQSTPPPVPEAPLIDLSDHSEAGPAAVQPNTAPIQDSSSSKELSASDKEKQASLLRLLQFRKDQYKLAARNHHKQGQTEQAKEFLMIAKQFDAAMEAVQEGQLFDESEVPPPPPLHASPPISTPEQPPAAPQAAQAPAESETQVSSAPPIPSTTMEGLQQRLEKYNSAVQLANQEGNSGKARRMGRIVKQYQDAIKMVKAGKPIDLEELPTPPGYPPLPPLGEKSATPKPQPSASPAQAPKPQPSAQVPAPKPQAPAPKPQPAPVSVKLSGRAGQQLDVLVERQREFKAAALASKKAGKIEEAKEFLRTSKGLEGMIAAAQGGVRVDLSQVPPSPAPPKTPEVEEENRDLWDSVEVVSMDSEQRSEIFKTLQDGLSAQIQTCDKNADHFSKIGDIPSSQSFQKMSQHCKNDLITIKNACLHGDPPPKFHYEDRSFTIVRTHTDLSASEAEVEIIRGINLPLPKGYSQKDMYIYISYEFPFPSEDSPTGNTEVVKHTVDPEFKETFKHPIDRKGRALGRVVKRQGVKLEVKYQRGFLKSDKTLGQATLKLASLENKSEVHECLELLDPEKGRRPVGGKIEAKVRLREPLIEKDVDIIKENWLVIDAFVRSKSVSSHNIGKLKSTPCQSKPLKDSPSTSGDNMISVEVLKMEYKLAVDQVSALQAKGKTVDPSLVNKCKILKTRVEQTQAVLEKADKATLKNYLVKVQQAIPVEYKKAQNYVKEDKKADAQLCIRKKKVMENEVTSLKEKLGLR